MEFGNAAKGNLRFWKASKVEGKPWVCRHLDGDWGQHQRSFQLLEDQSYGVLYVQFWRQIQRCIWPITNVFIIRQRSECWLPSVDINGSQHSSFSGDFECPGKRSETGVWRSQRAHLWTPHAVRILMTPTATKFIFRSLCSAEHSVMKNCDM